VTIPSFSDATLRKARALRALNTIEPDPDIPHAWWVPSIRPGGDTYRVQEDVRREPGGHLSATWVTCTCPFGVHRGSGQAHCSHAAAVLLGYLEEGATL
jgi:hypothetical protein